MRADNIQNVAYGSHPYKMDFESDFEVPNWIRKKVCFVLARQFKLEVATMNRNAEVPIKPPGLTWMYKVMDWVSQKDMVSLAGLDNTDVTGKEVFENLADLIKSLLEWPNIKVPDSLCGGCQKYNKTLRIARNFCNAILSNMSNNQIELLLTV